MLATLRHALPQACVPQGADQYLNAAAVAKLDRQSGVAITALGGRVTARFSPAARAAVEKVKVVPYVDRVEMSDNLRYALGTSDVAADQAPLGA